MAFLAGALLFGGLFGFAAIYIFRRYLNLLDRFYNASRESLEYHTEISETNRRITGALRPEDLEALDRYRTKEMIYSLKVQQVSQSGNLNKLLEGAADYGGRSSAPLKLQNDIEEVETELEMLEAKLVRLERRAQGEC